MKYKVCILAASAGTLSSKNEKEFIQYSKK